MQQRVTQYLCSLEDSRHRRAGRQILSIVSAAHQIHHFWQPWGASIPDVAQAAICLRPVMQKGPSGKRSSHWGAPGDHKATLNNNPHMLPPAKQCQDRSFIPAEARWPIRLFVRRRQSRWIATIIGHTCWLRHQRVQKPWQDPRVSPVKHAACCCTPCSPDRQAPSPWTDLYLAQPAASALSSASAWKPNKGDPSRPQACSLASTSPGATETE